MNLMHSAKYGALTIRKAYGNWKNPTLKPWEDLLNEYAIKPIQKYDLTKGKNASPFVNAYSKFLYPMCKNTVRPELDIAGALLVGTTAAEVKVPPRKPPRMHENLFHR